MWTLLGSFVFDDRTDKKVPPFELDKQKPLLDWRDATLEIRSGGRRSPDTSRKPTLSLATPPVMATRRWEQPRLAVGLYRRAGKTQKARGDDARRRPMRDVQPGRSGSNSNALNGAARED
jgi:hypothetical protein